MEQDLVRLFQKEVEFHNESENLKQRFECQLDYTEDATYKTMDPTNIGFIDLKILDSFFKSLQVKNVTQDD